MKVSEKAVDRIGFGIICLLIVLFVAGCVIGLAELDKSDAVNMKFQGVCEYLEGTVEGDVCVKDGKVVHSK